MSEASGSRIKTDNIVFFVAIFGSSIIGAKIGSISVNKLAIVPLVILMVCNGISLKIKKENNSLLVLLYCSMLISCIFALIRGGEISQKRGYYSTIINYIIQILIFYLPLCLAIRNKKNIALVKKHFLKNFLLVIKIHCVWAILQEIVYLGAHISINDLVFLRFLGGFGLQEWTSYILFDRLYIRVSGLNVDPAYFGIMLIIGFTIDKKTSNKYLYVLLAILTFSRTTIIGMGIAILLHLYYEKKITYKRILGFFGLLFAATVAIAIPRTRDLVPKVLTRFDFFTQNLSALSISSFRHINFYPYSLIVFRRGGIIEKMFGYGPRIDGVAFAQYEDVINGLGLYGTNLTDVWCAESDFVGLLLGCGFCGLCIYYLILFKLQRKAASKYRISIICLFAIGLMYNYYSVTFVNLYLIFFEAISSRKHTCQLPRQQNDN